eukprot:Gb_11868 [translate_table: standard]
MSGDKGGYLGVHTFSYLATTSSDHTVKIWNVDGFTLERTLTGFEFPSVSNISCMKQDINVGFGTVYFLLMLRQIQLQGCGNYQQEKQSEYVKGIIKPLFVVLYMMVHKLHHVDDLIL